MNLAEFPFTLVSDRVSENLRTMRFRDTIRGEGGKLVERTWTITASSEWGLPKASDEAVYVALMERAKEEGFADRTVHFTRYDLLQRMGWPRTRHYYQRIRQALQRLLGLSIEADKAFWDHRHQRYVTVGFNLIESFALYDEAPGRKRAGQETLPLSCVTWTEVIWRSLQVGYLKKLDTAFYFSLRSGIARRLFRYLDKQRFTGKHTFQIDLQTIAFDKVGLTRRPYYPSQLKQKLEAAHRELIEAGFLQGVEYAGAAGDVTVCYRFGRPPRRIQEPTKHLEAELEAAGVSPTMAKQLVRDHDEDVILRQLAYLPYRSAKDPAAVLVKSIVEDWAQPAAHRQAQEQRTKEIFNAAPHVASVEEPEDPRTVAEILAELPKREAKRLLAKAEKTIAQEYEVIALLPKDGATYQGMLKTELLRLLEQKHD